jgi:choline monooxygenase
MTVFDADFAALLEHNQGLPGRHFTDPAAFDQERTTVFTHAWVCVGLSADTPQHGDMRPQTVLGHPLLLVRDREALRVFHNVCSHRGAPLLEASAHGRARIVCPYHSWTYKLDGDLVSTPHVGGAGRHACDAIQSRELGLRLVRSAEWAGHVFIDLSGAAPAFEEWIRPVAQRFNGIDWSLLRRDPAASLQLEVAANWKIIVENFVESYHLPWVHKELQSVNPMAQHFQILGGHSYLGQGGNAYEGDRMTSAALPRMPSLAGGTRYESLAIFPNLILVPLADMSFSIIMLPEAVDRTHERVEFCFVGDAALGDEFIADRRKAVEFIAKVNAEDVAIVEAVQRGRHSIAFTGGQFSHAQEATSLQFQKILACHILAAGKTPPETVAPLPVLDIAHPA